MKKVIITGATGFIGGALTKRLLSDGVTVYGVDINPEKLEEMKQYGDFVPIVADFSVYDRLCELITERDFDVFYHFAWGKFYGEALKNYSIHLLSATQACKSFEQATLLKSKKYVYAQTANYFEIRNLIQNDVFEPRITSIYSGSKMVAELIIRSLASSEDIKVTFGAICMAYGEGNYSMGLPNVFINKVLKNESVDLIVGNNLYDLIYISDIVNAFIAIGNCGMNKKTYYIGHRKLKTFKELLTEVRDTLNSTSELNFGKYIDNQKMDYDLINLNELYNDTGFECTADFKESILKTANWLKSQLSTSTTGGGGK